MLRRPGRTFTTALALSALLAAGMGGVSSAASAPERPDPTRADGRSAVLDRDGRVVDAAAVATANRNSATRELLKQRAPGAAPHAKPAKGSQPPAHPVSSALRQRLHDGSGLPALRLPTAWSVSHQDARQQARTPVRGDAVRGGHGVGLATLAPLMSAGSPGSISGTVTDSVSHVALANVCVLAYGSGVTSACSDGAGHYSVTGLVAGVYNVAAEDHVSSHQSGYYGTGVTVTSGVDTTGIDFALAPGGSVSGLVTDAASAPLPGICVALYAGGDTWAQGCTDATGHYQTTGVAAGSYQAEFRDNTGPYLSQYFSGAATYATATPVDVVLNQVTSGIGATMQLGGTISGTLTDASASPAAGVCGSVLNAAGNQSVGLVRCSDASGGYTTSGLTTGSYLLDFYDPSGTYLRRFYPHAVSVATATAVAVVLGADTPGTDDVLPHAGHVVGQVLASDTSAPLANVCAVADDGSGHSWQGCTDAAGAYDIPGLESGSYHVSFTDYSGQGYLPRNYHDVEPTTGLGDAVAVVQAATTSALDEHLVLGGSISGFVTDEAGAPLRDVCVYASAPEGNGSACSDVNGLYDVVGLEAGSYHLSFYDNSGEGYLQRFYHDSDTDPGDALAVTRGQSVPALQEHLVLGGRITGTLTTAVGGTPAQTSVALNTLDGSGNVSSIAWTTSDVAGQYRFVGLDTGSYLVEFGQDGTYLPLWFDGQASAASATPVAVTRGVVTTAVDGALHVGGVITGTVTDATTGNPVQGVCVQALAAPSGDPVGYGSCTGPSGTYQVGYLPTGSYTLRFRGGDSGYLDKDLADVPAVQDQTATGVDAQLDLGGVIAGTLRDMAGNPLSAQDDSACAYALDAQGNSVGTAECADLAGHYRVVGLPAGSYTVAFYAVDYATEYFDDVTDPLLATAVAVSLGTTTPPVDASLARSAHIAGTVTDSATGVAPVSTSSLLAEAFDTGGNLVGSSGIAANGSYTIRGLASGSDTVRFSGGGYRDQWWDHVAVSGDATPVTATTGSTTSGIDASLTKGGRISGRVTETSGQPLAQICVEAFSPSDPYSALASSCTDAQGAYEVIGLGTGAYLVSFVDSTGPYLTQWANGKPDSATADFVNVVDGAATGGVDATMVRGATVHGTITDPSGAPAVGACVSPTGNAGSYVGTCSDDLGHYQTTGLPNGSYALQFRAPYNTDLVDEWWNDKPDAASADPIALTVGDDVPADVSLAQGGRISGTVTDSSANPVGTRVQFFDSGSGNEISSAYSDELTGSYTSLGLPAGTYDVRFGDGYGSAFTPEWYDNQADLANASHVTVSVGGTSSGVDASLSPVVPATGGISGTVRDSVTTEPVTGVCAYAYAVSDGSYAGSGCTDSAGSYTVSGVPAGGYTVNYTDGSGPYLESWYSTAPPSPTQVDVTDAVVTGVDESLVKGATVTGVFTDSVTHAPLSNVCVTLVAPGADPDTSGVGPDCSDSTGHYRSAGVMGASYQLRFSNPSGRYLTQWYGGTATQSGSTSLTLTTGQDTPGIDVAMTLGASVSGTVTESGTGLAIEGVCVRFHDAATGTVSSQAGCTSSTGHYSAVVPAGSYTVEYTDPSGQHADQWWSATGGVDTSGTAGTITVAAGDARTGVDVALPLSSATSGGVGGVVTDPVAAPVAGATVTLCSVTTCWSTSTDNAGTYVFAGKHAGDDDLTVYPPSGSSLNWGHAAVTIVAGSTVTQDLTLAGSVPIPAGSGITVDGAGPGSTPSVFWDQPVAITAPGCPGGTATYQVTDAGGTIVASGPLTEDVSGGSYSGSIASLQPNHGATTVTIAVTGCADPAADTSSSFTMYIDPSGFVKDTLGVPIAGAAVTLYRSDTATGTFTAVPNGSDIMSPANRVNPGTSDASGHYGWDVTSGFYKVTAQQPDCYAPGSYVAASNSVTAAVVSAVQQIPPPVTTLDLTLDCTNIVPVAAFAQSSTSVQQGSVVHFDATAASDANGSVSSYAWDFGDGSTSTGLTADHTYAQVGSYQPKLVVTDDQGLSSQSHTGSTITVGDVPGQVTGLLATGQLHSVALSWTAPAENNSTITGYSVDVSPGGQHLTPTTPSVTVTGLTGGTTYTFSVTATNGYGPGLAGTVQAVAGAASTAPVVTLSGAPHGFVRTTSGAVSFSVTVDPTVTLTGVTCALDGGAAQPCASPYAFSALTNGAHSVLVVATDSDGHVGSAGAQWVVDTVAPKASQLKPSVATWLSLVVPVAWSGSDLNGVASYDVRYAKAAWNAKLGAPVLWKSATTGRTASFTAARGYTYCFSSRARDAAGNVSAWTAARCTALPLDDRSLAASTGWKRVTTTKAYAGSLLQGAKAGLTLTRTGAYVGRAGLLVSRGYGYGSLVVYYNGVAVKSFSTSASTSQWRYYVALPKILKANTKIVIRTTSARTVRVDGLLLARI